MPFTLSHIAAVLPLRSRLLLPSGLVVGATVPDVPLFVSLSDRPTTHSLLGMVTWDLGMGLVLLAVFHLLLKRPLLALSPRVLRDRLTPVADGLTRRRALLAAVPSILLGTATHVAWDAFTHLTGPVVQAFPELTTVVNGMAFYRWAQYGSGVLGGLAVLVWAGWWLWRAPAVPSPGLPGWARVTVLLAAAPAVAAGLFLTDLRDLSGLHFHLRYAVTDSMVMLTCWALLYSLLYWASRPLSRTARAS